MSPVDPRRDDHLLRPGGVAAAPSSAAGPWPGPVPLRPLDLGDILSSAIGVLRFNPRTLFGISFVVLAVGTALGIAFGLLIDRAAGAAASPEMGGEAVLDAGGFASGPASLLVAALLVVPIADAALGRRTSTGETWRRARGRIPALLGYGLLVLLATAVMLAPGLAALTIGIVQGNGAVVAAGVVLLVAGLLAELVLSVFLVPGPAAIVLEGAGPVRAVHRSLHLIRGAFWRTLGIVVLTGLFTAVLAAVAVVAVVAAVLAAAASGLAADGSAASTPVTAAALGLLTVLVGTLVQPFVTTVHTLIYLDRRFRTEALTDALLDEARRAA